MKSSLLAANEVRIEVIYIRISFLKQSDSARFGKFVNSTEAELWAGPEFHDHGRIFPINKFIGFKSKYTEK